MFIFSMQSDNLAHDADEDSVTRSLEAYLLWLFGYIMFNNSHGAYVDRVLVPYAPEDRRGSCGGNASIQLGFSGTCSHVLWPLQGIGAK